MRVEQLQEKNLSWCIMVKNIIKTKYVHCIH